MTTRPGVKPLQKSSIRGVHITQFVDKIPKGCSTPDFERKPVSLTLQEGKNAIFRAVVKGVPAPEVKWKRAKGEINDPAKYLMFYSPATSEHILQINKITAGDSDLYRCFAVNEYGEASCSAGLRIIQGRIDNLKKSLQDLKKTLKKRAPLPKQKVLDKEAIFQLLLHADKKDYERICIKYGISDFRGMLRALQDLKKDTENEQAKLIHSIRNMEHIKVNKDGSASFSLEMDLKSASSNIYLLKDGEKVRYGTGDEYRKYYLRQIGKKYHFIVNDVHPEDAGLYQVRVEDVPIFSTELDAESIPVRFQKPLTDLRCHEEEDVIFECVLRTPCYDAAWLHKAHPLEASEKHQISVSPDGLIHQLIIKNAVTSDSGLYTLDTGLCSSRAWLLVERKWHTNNIPLTVLLIAEKVGGAHSAYSKGTLPAAVDMDGVNINREGEIGSPYSKGNLIVDAGGHVGQAGMSGLPYGPGSLPAGDGGRPGAGGSFVGEMEVLYGPDGLPIGAGVDATAAKRGDLYGKPGQLSEHYGKDGLPAGMEAGLGGAGLEGAGSIYGKVGVGGAGIAGAAGAGEFGPLYGKDGLPAGAVIGGTGAGAVGSPYGKDGLPAGAGAGVGGAGLAGAGGVGSPFGKDGLPAGAGAGAGVDVAGLAGAGGVGFPYGKDGLPVGAGAGAGVAAGAGAGVAGLAGAGAAGSPYGKDRLPAGAGAGVGGAGLAGAGGVGSPYGKDGLPAGAGAGFGGAGLAGAGAVGSPYGKDGLPAGAGAGVGVAGLAGAGAAGSSYGKDGLPAGAGAGVAGLAGAGGAGSPFGKDGLPAGAGAGAGVAGLAGAGAVGSPFGKDGLPAGAGAGGAGATGSPFGKDGLPAGAGVGVAGLAGAGGAGSPFGKDGLPAGAGAGAGAGVAGLAGAGGVGSPYGKDGLPAGAGAGAGVGGAGLAGAGGVGSPYGKDGLPAGAGGSVAGVRDAGSSYGKDGLSAAAVSGAAHFPSGGEEVMGSHHGRDAMLGRAQGSVGGVGGSGLSSEGGAVGGSAIQGAGSAYGSAGSRAGESGASRLGGGGSELHGKEGVVGAVGMGGDYGLDSHAGKSAYGEAGKGAASDFRGSEHKGSSHDKESLSGQGDARDSDLGQSGSLYDKDSSFGGAEGKFHDRLFGGSKPGLFSQSSQGSDQMSALYGGPPVSQRKQLTTMDGVSFEKEGLVHKLIISKAEDIHAGKYRFEAGDIKTEASIFVEDPPQVDEILLKNLMSVPTVAKAGEKVVIKIPFEGRLPVRAMWLKDKIELGDDSRVRVDKTDTFTMLSISSAERKDCGDYKVRLKNDSGILDIDLKVEVIDKPQPPAGPLKIVGSSAHDVTIQWNPPKDDGGKPIQNYVIEKQQVGKSNWVTLGEIPRSCTTFTTSKVEQDMSYYFRVRAVNAEGTSEALESDEVVTISKASPGAPDPPEIIGVSKDTITISWKAPRKTGGSRISGYIVQKRKKGSMTWVPVNSVPIKLKITDLKKGLQYEFCVAAVNASGMGDISAPSEAAFARDSTKPPGKVRDLKMTISDSSSVTLTWNAPEAEEGSGAKGYNVEMRSSNSLSWTKCNIFPIETTTYKVKGLHTKETYFLRVRAINDCGPGEATELEAFTEVVPPVVSPRFIIDKTVKNFLVIKAGNAIRVNIPFEAPPDFVLTWLKDGVPLPSRAKISTQDGTSQLLIRAAEFTDSGIYTVELMSGTGKRETFSFQVQVTDIPQPPGPIELRENVPNIVTVTWEPSTSEKRESNLFYTVLKRESQKGLWHVVGDLIYTNKFTYTKVIPGRDYYFRVVAKNHLGSSRPSDTVQPWRIRKQKADIQVRPQRYKGVNQNQPPRFLVPLKPHVVTTGSECRMSCAVGGHPPPKITWYKDGRDLSNNPSYFGTNDFGVCSLVIFGVSKADEGDYTVEATNDSGRAFSKASLTVKGNSL
uniref:Immunoglobulin like and fibronectin type III domain containing 1 n=1 Tax=Phasianus colchicus TaxID=9054 RepID=A0A669QF09_PHACC